ncbi:MAG TPA: SMP-30/gluconolactonase/LRE family protein [Phycisphaerae bacterium]|nr:SMP-30/gluconolactonase/LRE family protein [Phycisphaerae bacterium]
MSYAIEPVVQDGNKCGEAPTWDAPNRRVLWTDNETDTTYQYNVDTGERKVLTRGVVVSGIALNRSGGLLLGGPTGLHFWQDGQWRSMAATYKGEELKINDMIADPQGRIYAGTMYWGAGGMEKTGCLYLIAPDASVRVVDEGIELANGLGFSPDNRTLYFTDSTARKIYAYDVNPSTGELSGRRVVVQVPTDEGIPDGLTVDAEGYIWSAQWYGSQIVRYDPQGKVERRIAMPVKQVSSIIFGGDDLTDLYVTTAGQSWVGPYAPPGYDFNAPNIGGSLYRIRVGIQGRPEHLADFAW